MPCDPDLHLRLDVVPLLVGALTLLGLSGCPAAPAVPLETGGELGEPAVDDEGIDAGVVARAVEVRGPRGLSCPSRGKGVFLGSGAELSGGETVETPSGVQAQLALVAREGVWLRVAERTLLEVAPATGLAAALSRGEVVLEVERGKEPVTIRSGTSHVVVRAGEVRIAQDEAATIVDVLAGEALVEVDGGDRTRLTPGRRFVAEPLGPRPADGEEGVEGGSGSGKIAIESVGVSMLADAAWASSFDQAQRSAERLPRGMGTLVGRRPGSSELTQRLALVDQRVEVNVDGRAAHTRIRQTFRNESSQTLEGRYRFPLPSDASISELNLLVGDTWMQGEMLEKGRARRIFEQIVEATVPRDPALLEWEKGSEVELRVFPIPGNGERSVEIAYTQVLPRAGDSLRYRFPMGGSGVAEQPIARFAFDVKVHDAEGTLDPKRVRPVMFDAVATRRDGVIHVASASEAFAPTWDLGVDLPVADLTAVPVQETEGDSPAGGRSAAPRRVAASVSAQTLLDRDGQAYVLAALRPALPAGESKPVEWAIVLDRSHGTTPEGWMIGRGLVLALLASLPVDDHVTLLVCDTACDQIAGGRTPVEGRAASEVTAFLDAQVLAGASDLGAMIAAGSAALPKDATAERVVLYMGDGVPTSGAMAAAELREEVGVALDGARLFAVALGGRADVSTLDALVRASAGDLLRAGIGDAPEALVRELQLRAHVPPLRDLALETPSGLVDVHPKELPALRPGDELVLLAKLTKPVAGELVVREGGPMGPAIAQVPMQLEARPAEGRNAHLPRTWAKAEIDWRTATQGDAAREGVIALSRRHNVLSRWTAMLVLESDAMYREFGVARRSKDSTGWSGASGPSEADAASQGMLADDVAQPYGGLEPSAPDDSDARGASIERDEAYTDEALFDDTPSGREVSGASAEKRGGGGASKAAAPASPDPFGDSRKKSKSPWSDSASDEPSVVAPKDEPGKRAQPLLLRTVEIASAAARSDVDLAARIAAVEADPRSRSAHRTLVRAALAAGAADVKLHASAWAAADPEHPPALVAQADALSRAGDPLALRAYASAADVEPFSRSTHERLATAFALAGEVDRACSHRRALVSLDPSNAPRRAAWQACRSQVGQPETRALSAAPRPSEDVVVFVEGDGHDLELALVDRGGRRGSTQWPAKVRAARSEGAVRLARGTIATPAYVEVTRRASAGGQRGPVPVRVVVRTPDATRSFDLELAPGETRRVARVFPAWRAVK